MRVVNFNKRTYYVLLRKTVSQGTPLDPKTAQKYGRFFLALDIAEVDARKGIFLFFLNQP